MKALARAQESVALRLATPVTARQLLLVGLLVGVLSVAFFTRFWRLGTPGEFYFDEVYFPDTAQKILGKELGADEAGPWEFFGSENTHPPLSKLLMAGGMAIFGVVTSGSITGEMDNPYAWRFFGALAGVGSVVFIYLLGRRLFKNEFIGLAAAFLLTFEGLAFTQSRIATPDSFILFFILGSIYFLVSDRVLLSGILFGAALATKLSALLTVFPIVIYLLYRYWRGGEGRQAQFLYLVPLALVAFYLGTPVVFGGFLVEEVREGVLEPDMSASVFSAALGAWMVLWALAPIALYLLYRLSRWWGGYKEDVPAESFVGLPLFFVLVPLYVYFLTYLPMLLSGHSLGEMFLLNRDAYQFHSVSPQVSGPEASHPYESAWNTWPILLRPVFLHVSGSAKIYNLGNPIIFWFGLPALGFALWQGMGTVKARLDAASVNLSISGSLTQEHLALLFVVLTYLALWLPWAIQPRLLFLYHYLPALPFLILALAYALYRLWQLRWGRPAAVAFLAVVALTFVYFYPHLAAVSVPGWLGDSYFWLDWTGVWDWS